MYVYKITNNINGKVYIGITKNYMLRWRQHINTSTNSNHTEYNKVLYCAFRKYGVDSFSFEVVYTNVTTEEAKTLEIQLIEKFNSLVHYNGYNVTPGGDLVETTRFIAGELNSNTSLTNAQVANIIARRDLGELQRSVYADYVSFIQFSGFSDIWIGRSWSHLQPTTIAKRNGNRYLTDSEVRIIRTLKGTKSYKCIGEDYGVPTSTISNIINNRTYITVT